MSKEPECGEILMAALLINKGFCMAAKGGDTISKNEAVKLLRDQMGPETKKEDIEKVFATLDSDGSGTLDFQEFLALTGSLAMMFNQMMKQ
ncbi:protein S100-A6-like [Eucyclogobius newberryi]|uniref:protein S100-A6-like n=1 Tax=Eucyclogobius newberryi TaxID=166745 RepID=UPI003B5BAF29